MTTTMHPQNQQRSPETLNAGSWSVPTLHQAHAAELARLIRAMHEQQTEQLALVREHRAAIAKADNGAMARCTQGQKLCAQKLAEIEARRLNLVRVIVQGSAPVRLAAALTAPGGAAAKLTLSQLVEKCPESARMELRKSADALRALAATVASEQSVLSSAARSLLSHMNGLMERLSRAVSHTGTYRRPGTAVMGGHGAGVVISSVDLTS